MSQGMVQKLDAGWRSEARGVEEHGMVERGERVSKCKGGNLA